MEIDVVPKTATLVVMACSIEDAVQGVSALRAEGEIRGIATWLGPDGPYAYDIGSFRLTAMEELPDLAELDAWEMSGPMLQRAYEALPDVEEISITNVTHQPETRYTDEYGEEHTLPANIRVSGQTTWYRHIEARVWGPLPALTDHAAFAEWSSLVLLGPNPPVKPPIGRVIL